MFCSPITSTLDAFTMSWMLEQPKMGAWSCKQSVNWKGNHHLASEFESLTMGLRNGMFYSASTTPLTTLDVNLWLHHVGIFIDMDIGTHDESLFFTFTKISTMEPLHWFLLLQIYLMFKSSWVSFLCQVWHCQSLIYPGKGK